MRWLLTKNGGDQPGAIITSGRTRREMIDAGLRWLSQHPDEQRCYATDTRSGRGQSVTRRNRPRARHHTRPAT